MSTNTKKLQTQQTLALKNAYKAYIVQSNIKRLRIGCLLGGTLVPLGAIFDYFIYPAQFKIFFFVRLVFGLLYGLIYFISFSQFTKKHSVGMMLLLTELIAVPIVLMIQFTGGYQSPYYAGLNLIILGVGVLFTWMTSEALVVCSLIYLTYLVPIFLFDQITDYTTFFNNNYFISFTIIIAVVSNYFASKLRESDFINRYKLSDAVEQLSQLDKAKTNFFSNISHELRTPLTLILAPIENILKQETLSAQSKELLKICHGNALRLLKLINNLLDIVRINTGRMELRYSKKDITELLKKIVINVSPLAEKKNIQIEFNSKGGEFIFFWDEDQLEKVVVNIIYNALKFTPENGKIELFCEDKGAEVMICVKDSGIGIPKEQLNKIFEPFYQVESGSKRTFEGSGMGLALCKQIVELHGGKIWAESFDGKGATISFLLPKKLESTSAISFHEDQKEDWTKQVSREAIYEANRLVRGKKEVAPKLVSGEMNGTILVVEDNPDMREFICSELSCAYNVLRAANGKEGLEVAMDKLPDLVISDVMMPEMDGYELCKHLKAGEKTKQIPVLMLTSKTELDMRLTGYEQGADDYVAKPFNVQELLAKAKALIQGRRLEREMELYRRLASVGEIAAGVAHEINNALNVSVAGNRHLKKMLTQLDRPEKLQEFLHEAKEDIELLSTGMERAHHVVKSLLTFSKKNSEGFKYQSVHEGVESTLQMLNSEFAEKEIVVHKEFCANGEIFCDLNQLNQVFFNVLKNACDAVEKGGAIWIRTWREGERFFVSIRDNGAGIAEKNIGRIFDPFFTTKPIGKGTGLGLNISYNIVNAHKGKIECQSEVGKGTEFKIELPVEKEKNEPADSRAV